MTRPRGPWERLLLRLMGPPQVGPYDDTPDPALRHRAERREREQAAESGGQAEPGEGRRATGGT